MKIRRNEHKIIAIITEFYAMRSKRKTHRANDLVKRSELQNLICVNISCKSDKKLFLGPEWLNGVDVVLLLSNLTQIVDLLKYYHNFN